MTGQQQTAAAAWHRVCNWCHREQLRLVLLGMSNYISLILGKKKKKTISKKSSSSCIAKLIAGQPCRRRSRGAGAQAAVMPSSPWLCALQRWTEHNWPSLCPQNRGSVPCAGEEGGSPSAAGSAEAQAEGVEDTGVVVDAMGVGLGCMGRGKQKAWDRILYF